MLRCGLFVEGGAKLLLVQRALGAFDDGGEGGGIADGDVGQDLPIDERAGGFEAGHELRIGNPVEAGGGGDAGDPELPEITFSVFSGCESGGERFFYLLPSDPVTA